MNSICLAHFEGTTAIAYTREDEGKVEQLLQEAIAAKPEDHEFGNCYQPGRPMTAIGG